MKKKDTKELRAQLDTFSLLVLVIYANMMFVHSGVLWVILGCGFGLEVFVWLLVWYLRRKGWV